MKAHDFLPQIERKHLRVNWEATCRALVVGYFLKSVVADNFAVPAKLMSGDHSHAPSITLLALVFAFSAQIFPDFSGYSLIRPGCGTIFSSGLAAAARGVGDLYAFGGSSAGQTIGRNESQSSGPR